MSEHKWEDIKFAINREGPYYVSRECSTSAIICKARLHRECLQTTLKAFADHGVQKTKEAIDWYKRNAENKAILHSRRIAAQFKEYFAASIDDYINNFIDSFDIIWFDRFLNTPAGTSTREWITSRYSAEAAKFIEYLLSL